MGPDRAWRQEPMAETGRLPGANRPSLPGWGNRQRYELDGSLGWQLVPRGLDWKVACGSAVSESEHAVSKVCWTGARVSPCWPEGSRGTGGARRRGPGRGPLNPNWVGIGRHD